MRVDWTVWHDGCLHEPADMPPYPADTCRSTRGMGRSFRDHVQKTPKSYPKRDIIIPFMRRKELDTGIRPYSTGRHVL